MPKFEGIQCSRSYKKHKELHLGMWALLWRLFSLCLEFFLWYLAFHLSSAFSQMATTCTFFILSSPHLSPRFVIYKSVWVLAAADVSSTMLWWHKILYSYEVSKGYPRYATNSGVNAPFDLINLINQIMIISMFTHHEKLILYIPERLAVIFHGMQANEWRLFHRKT